MSPAIAETPGPGAAPQSVHNNSPYQTVQDYLSNVQKFKSQYIQKPPSQWLATPVTLLLLVL